MKKETRWPMMTLASGPVEVSERAPREESRLVLYHYDPAFIDPFERTSSLLHKVFRTRYDAVIMQGEAAHPTYLAAQLAIFERSLADLGFPVNLGTGVGAAMAAL